MFTLSGLIKKSNASNASNAINASNASNANNQIAKQSETVSFSHGINVILLAGEYKGYYGTISNFYPASYKISTDGYTFVDSELFGPIKQIGSSIITSHGESVIEKYIPRVTGGKLPKIIIYKKLNKMSFGLIIMQEEKSEVILPIEFEMRLEEEFANLQIDDKAVNLERLAFYIKDNQTLFLHPELLKLESTYEIINQKDIIESYYFNLNNSKFTPYNPSKDVYYISYTNILEFNPNMLQVQPDKTLVLVKKGPFATGKLYKIKSYSPSKLSVILGFNGKVISNHIKNNKLVPISVSDVFYMDILLKNGSTVQINKIEKDNTIQVLDKNNNKYIINRSEIETLLQGTTFKTIKKDIQKDVQYIEEHNQDESEVAEQESSERNQENQELDYDTLEHDYGTEEVMEQEPVEQVSFKDTQRSSIEYKLLTEEQTVIKSYIDKICQLLSINFDSMDVDIYTLIDIIQQLVLVISKLTNPTFNFSMNSYEIKYITLLVMLYKENLNININKLFPKYFTKKDILNLNQNIFLKDSWYPKFNERIRNSVLEVKKLNLNKNSSVDSFYYFIDIILHNCDIILQDILHTNVNVFLKNSLKREQVFVPLGINSVTGKRVRDEKEDLSLSKITKVLKYDYLSLENVLKDNIPEIEVPIQWGPVNLLIIQSFQSTLQNEYIKENLIRAPFALRNDDISESLRNDLLTNYQSVLSNIQDSQNDILLQTQQDNLRTIQIQQNRKRILENKPINDNDEDEIVIKDTPSYIKEQKKRIIENMINKASKNTYKYGAQ